MLHGHFCLHDLIVCIIAAWETMGWCITIGPSMVRQYLRQIGDKFGRTRDRIRRTSQCSHVHHHAEANSENQSGRVSKVVGDPQERY